MLKILYNGTAPVDGDYVYDVRYSHKAYDDVFKLGATPCREVHLTIDKQAYNAHPNYFTLVYNNGTTDSDVCKLYIDNIDDTNDYYYSYTCLDSMYLFNIDMDFTEDTVYNLVLGLMTKHGLTGTPTGLANNTYPGNMVVSWSDYCTEREFIGYVAELLGRYAWITPANGLAFLVPPATAVITLNPDDVADLTIGAEHYYTRVVWDAVAHYEYGTTDGETLYLNPDNILFNDSATTSIQDQVNNIGRVILGNTTRANFGLRFWNMKVSQAVLPENVVLNAPGRRIAVNNGTDTYSTWLQPNYTYNNGYWIGGVDTELKTQEQEETEVVNTETKRAINSVNTRIDRQAGTIDLIGRRVDDAEDVLIHLQVNAPEGEVRITNEDVNPPKSYTSFKGDGMRIYVEGEQVAEATKNRFNCDKGLGVQDWAIEHGDDATVLMIYRLR